MATITWKLATGGNWGAAANWTGGVVPTAADTAVISTAAAATISVAAGNFTVGALTTAATDTFAVTGGNWTDNGVSTLGGAFALTAGSATFKAATSIAGAMTVTAGTFGVGAGATVTASGGGTFDTQANFAGPGTLTTSGTLTLVPTGTYVMMGKGLTWNNAGVVNSVGFVYAGIAALNETLTVNNQAGATYNLTTDNAGFAQNFSVATFNNAGTLAKTGGGGTDNFVAVLNSTGAIQVNSGTLALNAGGTISGSESGAGVLRVASAVTLAAGANIAGTISVGGNLLTSGAATVSGSLVVSSGAMAIAKTAALSVTGSAVFDTQSTFAGPGTLSTSGAVSLVPSGSYVVMGQGLTWNNSGVVTAGGLLYAGLVGGIETFALNNLAGGSFNLTTDAAGIAQNAIVGNLTNAGTLAKTGGVGTSTIFAMVASTGTINVATGTLALPIGATLSGAVTGAGTLALTGGTSTIASTTAMTVSTLAISGGTLSVTAGSLPTINSQLTVSAGTVAVAAGTTLTVAGNAVFGSQSTFAGPGTLVTTGTVSIAPVGSYIFMGQGLTWNNAGTVNATGWLYEGFASASETFKLNNQAGASFNFLTDSAEIIQGTIVGTVTNAGTLAKTGGIGISSIQAPVTSTGTINVATGILALGNSSVISGSVIGAGTLAFTGGTNTISSTTNVSVGTLTVTGGTLDIAASTSGAIVQTAGRLDIGASIAIGGSLTNDGGILSIAAGATVIVAGGGMFDNGAPIVGPGTLVTGGTVTLVTQPFGSYVNMGGGLVWNNGGVVNAAGVLYTGLSLNDTFTLNNLAGATFNLTSDAAKILQLDSVGTVSNAGTLAKTGGNGVSAIEAAVTSTGTINVAAGTLTLNNGAAISGTVSGAGTLALAGGTNSIASGTNVSVATLAVTGGTLATTAGSLPVINSKLSVTGGQVAIAAGVTLTAAGGGVFDQGATFSGPGVLVTGGTVSLAPSGNNVLMGQGLTWNNTGVVNATGWIYQGQSAADTFTLNNQAGASFNLLTDQAGLLQFNVFGTMTNAGTLAKTGGVGVSHINATMSSTGSIVASTGTLQLDSLTTLSGGTIGGSGTGQVRLAGNTSVSGTLTVLDNTSSTSLSIVSGVALSNSGTILDGGLLNFGAVGAPGTLTNLAGGVINITSNSGGIAGTAVVSNAGTIAKTGGTGLSSINVSMTNSGLIDAAAGTLKLNAAVSGTGFIRVDSGATLEIAGVASSIGAKQTIALNGAGATLKLDKDITFTNPLVGYGVGHRIDLVGMLVSSTVINGATLTITPTVGAPLNYVSTASLTGDIVGLASDGNGGTMVSLYRAASAGAHRPEPVILGPTHVGVPVTQAVTIDNTAAADGFSEALNAALSGSGPGFTTGGSFTGLAAGQSNASALTVTLGAAAAGAITGTATLALATDGTGIDGRGPVALASQTVNVKGSVFAYAAPALSANVVNLGATRVGGAALTGAVSLANSAVAPVGFQESLIYAAGVTPAAISLTNAAGTLAAGGTAVLGVSLGTAAAGDFTATAVAIAETSSGAGTSGLANTALAAGTLTVNGQVYATATPKLSSATINLGIYHVGDVAALGTLTLTNANPAGSFSDVLLAGTASVTGSYTGVVTQNIAAGGIAPGGSGTVTFGLNTTTAGLQSGTETLTFLSHDAVLADIATAPVTVTVTAAVDNYAVATVQTFAGPALTGSAGNYTLNLGTVVVGGAAASATLGVVNSAPGLADLLSGSFTLTGQTSSFSNTGFGSFGGLGAGQSESAQVITLPGTLAAGVYTETIVLTPTGSNASGYSGVLSSQTITVRGTVVTNGVNYNITRAPVSITAGGGDDTFTATGGTLNSRDQLDGGGGTNTIVLRGAGSFDLGAPAKLTNMQVVTALEGQAASGTIGDSTQTIYLRDGLDLTLNVTAGTPVAGNTNPESILIYGGLNNDIINLSTGNDTVVLGGAGTVVRGGSGGSLVQTTAAFAGALVVGAGPGANATTLEITNGGTVALNAGDNNIVVKLDAATNLTLNGMAFVSAVGQVQGNTIIAGAAGQTLGGIAGKDTLVGFTGFGNTFLGTAVGLNGDTISNFGGSDIIDITNMNFATLKPLTYAPGVGKGVLTVSDGTRTDKFTMVGSFTLANFTASSDGAAGTAIKWHA